MVVSTKFVFQPTKGTVLMSSDLHTTTESAHDAAQHAVATAAVHVIHIFVEVSKTDHRKVTFDHDRVTGADIKNAANVPLDSDLAIREPGKLEELVTNDEPITITDGEHFVSLPAGTIS